MLWPLVGRDGELGEITAALAGGRSGGVVLSGDAGVGKTRLAAEALQLAAGDGCATEWVVATPAEAPIPLAPFATLLPPLEEAGDRYQMLVGAAKALADRAGGRRLVLAVDDAHLLDDVSAALVSQLARRRACFLVATVRAGEPVPDAVSGMWRDGVVDRIGLRLLPPDDVAALLSAAVGGPLEAETAHRLWVATEGNPLFLRELVADGLQSGHLQAEGSVWRWEGPVAGGARLAEVVELRLGRLRPAEREALEAVAIGEPLGAATLEKLVPAAELTEIERRGLLELRFDGRRAVVRLGHPLYGEVLRRRMPVFRARAVRRGLADLVESIGGRRRTDLLQVAGWRLDADGSADAGLLERAADVAERAADHVLAERFSRAALAAGGGFVSAYALGRALYWQGRAAEAGDTLAVAGQWARSDSDRAQAAITRSSALFWGGVSPELAERVLADAIAAVAHEGDRAQLIAHRASLELFAGTPARALDAVQPLLAAADLGRVARLRALVVAAPALAMSGQLDDAARVFEAGLAMALAPENTLRLAAGQLVVSQFMTLIWSGRLDEATGLAEAAYRTALTEEFHEALAMVGVLVGAAHLARGHLAPACRSLEAATTRLARNDQMGFHGWGCSLLALARAQAGEFEAARVALEAGEGRGRFRAAVFLPDRLRAEAWAASAGRGELALLAARAAHDNHQWMHEVAAGHDAARLGRSREVAGRLGELAGLVEGDWAAACARHAAGLAGGDPSSLEEAARYFESAGFDLLAAEAWADSARLLSRAGRGATARAAMARAATLAAKCGRAATPALAAIGPASTLTAREREIAALAADGWTSPAIAERLVVSVRTVDNHLAHVYDKLGVRSRAELASLLARS